MRPVICVHFSPQRRGMGLSGETDQRFELEVPLEYDEAAFVTIYVRLYGERLTARPSGGPGWATVPGGGKGGVWPYTKICISPFPGQLTYVKKPVQL